MSIGPTSELKRINYLTAEIDAAYHQASLKLGLSDSESMILYAICNQGEECLLQDILRLSGMRKQTVNSALRKMESEHLLYLVTADGKKKKVCLTPEGKALTERTTLRLIQMENEIFGAWSKEDRTRYLELTQKFLSDFLEKLSSLS